MTLPGRGVYVDDDQEEIQNEHLQGEHYGNPHPDCWICWDEDDEPEAPDPYHD